MSRLDLEVGAELPQLAGAPVTRSVLALFAGASADHNEVHIDATAARAAGFDDVFAHGMLSMALLAHYVRWLGEDVELEMLSSRFVARTPVGARPSCRGRVVSRDGHRAVLDLRVELDDGTTTVVGSAIAVLDPAAR